MQGEAKATTFAELYGAYARDVFRFALYLSGDTALAQDITSETFLHVWRAEQPVRLGSVGTDTSHVPAFTRILNDASSPNYVPGARVVAAYEGGTSLPVSANRVEKFAAELQSRWGVE